MFAVLVVVGLWLLASQQSQPATSDSPTQDDSSSSSIVDDLGLGGIVSEIGTYLKSFITLPDDVSQLIEQYAAQYGVDPNLAKAQAWYESRGKQSAVSPAGAIGVFQLEPATAAGLGVNPYDLAQNIQGGIKYLSQMLARYDGNVSLALAAYNAGPGNVAKYGGIPPFAETQKYVSNILAAIGATSI